MSCARRDHREAKKRAKEAEVLTDTRPQIFAALMEDDDLQKLVELLLVTSIVRERT